MPIPTRVRMRRRRELFWYMMMSRFSKRWQQRLDGRTRAADMFGDNSATVRKWLVHRTRSVRRQTVKRRQRGEVQATQQLGGPRRETEPAAHTKPGTGDCRLQPCRRRGQLTTSRPRPPRATAATVRHALTTGRAASTSTVPKARSPAASHTPTTTAAARCPNSMIRCPPVINGIAKPCGAAAPECIIR